MHPGDAGWHFVTVPADVAEDLRAIAAGSHRPFGSLPVEAAIGATSWRTSLFSDKKSGSYLLPVKAEVRRKQRLAAGDEVTVEIDLAL